MKNIVCYIEQTAQRYPDQVAISDGNTALTYQALLQTAQCAGTYLAKKHIQNSPIAVYMDKTPACVAAFLAVAYSGNFYVVLDTAMPPERISRIFETLHPAAVLSDASHWEQAQVFCSQTQLIAYESATKESAQMDLLHEIRSGMTESDPLYILYTSGSTGRPKGTVVSHRAVIAYTQWVIDTFGIDQHTIFGSQTPFYFSMSVTDLYSSLRTGARLQIIPRDLFSFPLMLLDYMNKNQINTIYWVPSAMSIVANWDTFTYAKPDYLQKVLFAGEVMPIKQLNYWRQHLPDLFYANLFGPTETTDICTYYVVDQTFENNQTLPIGKPCDNCRVLVLDENGQMAESGELYVGGPFLADGYYNDPEKTAAAFVPNPCNHAYPQTLYRTGDLVQWDKTGNLLYLGRRDYQIKHMGYRIELGEIEANASAIEGMRVCVCIYDDKTDRIVLLYQGSAKTQDIMDQLRSRVPGYMLPNVIIRLKQMRYTPSGKIDRNYFKQNYQQLQ